MSITKIIAFLLFSCTALAQVPYQRVHFPHGLEWNTCKCEKLHYAQTSTPANGELRIDYKALWPGDLTNRPIVCHITNGPPLTTITVKEEAWDHIIFNLDGPGKAKQMNWECDFVVPKN